MALHHRRIRPALQIPGWKLEINSASSSFNSGIAPARVVVSAPTAFANRALASSGQPEIVAKIKAAVNASPAPTASTTSTSAPDTSTVWCWSCNRQPLSARVMQIREILNRSRTAAQNSAGVSQSRVNIVVSARTSPVFSFRMSAIPSETSTESRSYQFCRRLTSKTLRQSREHDSRERRIVARDAADRWASVPKHHCVGVLHQFVGCVIEFDRIPGDFLVNDELRMSRPRSIDGDAAGRQPRIDLDVARGKSAVIEKS